MMPLEIIPYLIEEVTYTTPLYYTSVVKFNGGVAWTHVCTLHNNYALHTKTGYSHAIASVPRPSVIVRVLIVRRRETFEIGEGLG